MSISQKPSTSYSLVRLIGYSLLAISLIHIIDVFIPPDFTNPTWEFSITALLLERIPLPLVGLAMVFWGGSESRSKWEKLILKLLSWSLLVVGILCLLLIPFCVSASLRLNNQTTNQINAQYEQQISQLEQAQSRLNNATSEEISRFLESFRNQNSEVDLITPQALKDRLTEEIGQARQNAAEIQRNTQQSQRLGLQKNTLKWVLVSLVSASIFIYAWHVTHWARRLKLK